MTAVQLWTHDCRRPFPDPASVSLRLPPSEWTATGCWRDRSRALAIDGEEPLTAATHRCTRRGCSANPNVRMPRRTGTGSPVFTRVHTAIAQRAYDHHVGRPPPTDLRVVIPEGRGQMKGLVIAAAMSLFADGSKAVGAAGRSPGTQQGKGRACARRKAAHVHAQ
jgi:hypothetical protein